MSNETIPMRNNQTQAMIGNNDSGRLILTKDVFKTNKETYNIDLKQRIGIGGESQVYLGKRISDDEQVVIKIYDTYPTDDQFHRKNRKAILDLLYQNSQDFKKTHIMPLWDDGQIEMQDEDGEIYTRTVDVLPYCKDSSLQEYGYDTIKNKVIPSVLEALNLLHANNLVHRDIKPSNIFVYDDVVLLADFGTTSQILNISSHNKTLARKGTPGYTAPEISDNYYVKESDYYSLGCTIATLYNKGRHIYQNLLDANDFESVNISMRRDGLPLDCPVNESELQLLVNALIMRDEKMRAGYEAVKLWLTDEKSFVSHWENTIQRGYEKQLLNFNFDGTVCNTYSELTDAILKKWETGKKYLYNGTMKGAFDRYDQTLANKAYDITESQETASNHDLGLAMFLHYLNTTDDSPCPIYWCGETYNQVSGISTVISTETVEKENIISLLTSNFLSWKYTNTKSTNQETIIVLSNIEKVTKEYPSLGYMYLMYSFSPDKNIYKKASDDIFKTLTKDNGKWYSQAEKMLKDDTILASIVHVKDIDAILSLKKSLTGNFISDKGTSDLFLLYKLFEAICKDKQSVRKHYLKYGPHAYLYWLYQNLNLYTFNSEKAKAIRKKIEEVSINENMSIDELNHQLQDNLYRCIEKEFLPSFQNNYLLTVMGLQTDKDTAGISTKNTHAFFAEKLYGITVPVGYLKSIGLLGGFRYE